MVRCKIKGYCKYVLGHCDSGGTYFGGDAMVWFPGLVHNMTKL